MLKQQRKLCKKKKLYFHNKTFFLEIKFIKKTRDVEPEPEPEPPEPAFFGPPGAGAGFSMIAPEPEPPAPAPGRLKAKFLIIHERK